jgi:hypothetical protein
MNDFTRNIDEIEKEYIILLQSSNKIIHKKELITLLLLKLDGLSLPTNNNNIYRKMRKKLVLRINKILGKLDNF